jgi:hypothetical protein
MDQVNARAKARQDVWNSEDAELRKYMGLASGAGGVSLSQMVAQGGGAIRGRYDSALTTDDNRAHWAMADGLAADAAANPNIRYVLRNRSRYEVANNCYAKGVGETIANYMVGTGPRLHIDDEQFTPEIRADVEAKFQAWCKAIQLADKLRTMRKARRQDGEAFALKITNPGVKHPVKLDLRLIEADQVRFVNIALLTVPSVDGIRFDDYGNPVSYHVLRVHPGYWAYATGYIGMPWEFDVWDAANVIHWFRKDRPGQHRGLPEILPALPLYATLRRYTQAVLDAAETAADFAVLLETEAGASDGSDEDDLVLDPMTTTPLAKRMMMNLPRGFKANQMKAEQPTTQYVDFKNSIAGEIGRCESVPPVVVLCDSSDSNFASGKLDHGIFFDLRKIERVDAGIIILDPLFDSWLQEAALVPPENGKAYIPREMGAMGAAGVAHSWHFDSVEMGNPQQIANAKETELRTGCKTLPEIWAEKGKDWRKGMVAEARALGLVDGPEGTALEQLQKFYRDFRFATRGGTEADPLATEAPDSAPAKAPAKKPAGKKAAV